MTPRLALLIPRLGRYGGVEGFGWRLAQFLAPNFNVQVLCCRHDGPAPEGVGVVRLGRILPGRWGKLLWFALAAEWARRRGKYDATIGLGPSLVQDILRMSGAPTQPFWQLSLDAYPPGWPRRLKTLRRHLSLGGWLAMAIESYQIRRAPIIVANSHLVRQILLETFPFLQGQSIPVIYNAPDTSRFHPPSPATRCKARTRLGIPEQQLALGTAATNFRLKGIFPLMESLRHLPPHIHLYIAGGRSSKGAMAHAQCHGVVQRVHFLGRVEDMPQFYAALDLFVLNTFYDACANAVLEALAMGLPTVSTVRNGSSAFLVPEAIIHQPQCPEEVARTVQTCLGRPTARDFRPPMGLAPYRELIHQILRTAR